MIDDLGEKEELAGGLSFYPGDHWWLTDGVLIVLGSDHRRQDLIAESCFFEDEVKKLEMFREDYIFLLNLRFKCSEIKLGAIAHDEVKQLEQVQPQISQNTD